MENLILFLATSLVIRFSSSTTKRFKSKYVGNTGCRALLGADADFEVSTTGSGDRLYFHEFEHGNVGYGMICVEMQQRYGLHTAETMLRSYMAKLKGCFRILHDTGMYAAKDWNTGHSKAVIDYWQDHQSVDWKVKGYTDGKVIAVLYVKNIGDAQAGTHDRFLDGFYLHTGR